MATKSATKTAKVPQAPTAQNDLQTMDEPQDWERRRADLTTEGLYSNAVLLEAYSATVAGRIDLTEAVYSLRRTASAVVDGDLRSAETMLVGQAGALNAIFAELARRAALNMGERPDAFERYMRLALKAQGQCRATLETLAAIKNPSVVFARQANINNGGQQQVNNGPANPVAASQATLPAIDRRKGGCDSPEPPAEGIALSPTQGISSARAPQ